MKHLKRVAVLAACLVGGRQMRRLEADPVADLLEPSARVARVPDR